MSYNEEGMNMIVGDDFYRLLDVCFEAQLKGGVGSSTVPAMMGPPGIGKTQKLHGWAEWKLRTQGKSVHIHTVILSQNDSVDIGGAWAPDFETGTLRHLITRDILGEIKGVEADIIVVFFDELGNANPATRTAIQSLLEDGQIRGNLKRDNCVYAVASNRPEDGCGATKLERSLVEGRLVMIDMDVDYNEWLEWAIRKGLHPRAVAPIKWRPELLYKYNPKAKGVNPNPRGREKYSNLLFEMEDQEEKDPGYNMLKTLEVLAPACISEENWHVERGYWAHAEELPLIEEIEADPEGASVPGSEDVNSGPSGQWAIATNIASHLRTLSKKKKSLSVESANAFITYMNRLHEEIGCFGVTLCASSHEEFTDCKAFSEFKLNHKELTFHKVGA